MIAPELETLHYEPSLLPYQGNTATFRMKWTVWDRDENIVWLNSLTGQFQNKCFGFNVPKCVNDAWEAAIRQHFQNALDKLLESPWWKRAKTPD